MSTDKRRFKPVAVRERRGGIYELRIDGVMWSEVEWSPSRQAFCIQDAAGHCLTHTERIHATIADPQEAVRLAKRMILDGRMPTPEEALRQLEERHRAIGESLTSLMPVLHVERKP
jgi:hypothetical protein